MTMVIATSGLRKSFGHGKKRFHAVDNLNLEVAPGQVYGFLGHNGAGKSTTIRMLLGLMHPSTGTASLFGKPVSRAVDILQNRVGSLVEGATLYPFLTGRQNLDIIAKTAGCYDKKRLDELLALVGMTDRADRKTKGYSTGMKQRIGLAAALLNNPDLVILDEPTSGLDPRGIQEIRNLIRSLVDEHGKTVFLSSHMLHEVEQICDRVAIINHGTMIEEGRVTDLIGTQATLRLSVSPCEEAADLLRTHYEVLPDKDDWLRVQTTEDNSPQIIRLLTAANIDIYQLVSEKRSLEEYFLAVTGENNGQQTSAPQEEKAS